MDEQKQATKTDPEQADEEQRQSEQIEKPSLWNRFRPGKWRKKERDLLFKLGAVLVVGLILMNVVGGTDTSKKEPVEPTITENTIRNSESELEHQLEAILCRIKGAGTVSVAITFVTSAESQYAVDREVSESSDTDGGIQTQNRTSVTQVDGAPLVVKETMPEIQGVLVVAQGAKSSSVKRELLAAVTGLLNISAHRVNIVEGN